MFSISVDMLCACDWYVYLVLVRVAAGLWDLVLVLVVVELIPLGPVLPGLHTAALKLHRVWVVWGFFSKKR